jgi:hypothetical protein
MRASRYDEPSKPAKQIPVVGGLSDELGAVFIKMIAPAAK